MRDDIDDCNYLYLRELGEPEENVLRIIVEEARASGPPEDIEILGKVISGTRPIESDESCRLFEFIWPSYVAYSVCNELYTSWDDTEVWEGRLFRVYSKSHFRDYVAKATFASDDYPGPLHHWCLVCLNHVVDIIACVEPTVSQLRPVDPSAEDGG
jgi:hypothetical protein